MIRGGLRIRYESHMDLHDGLGKNTSFQYDLIYIRNEYKSKANNSDKFSIEIIIGEDGAIL